MAQFKTKHGYEGLLIVIEGTDGSGKSTQLELLKNQFRRSHTVLWSRNGKLPV